MRIPIAELIDRMAILKLKIERVGEPHLKKEYDKYEKAVLKYKSEGIIIDKRWFDKLYKINGKIWDIEFDLREIVNKLYNNISVEMNDEDLVEIGKKRLSVEKLTKKRNVIVNQIVDQTGEGFKTIKIDYPDK